MGSVSRVRAVGRTVATTLLLRRGAQTAALRLAAARGRGLVLVYHRVRPEGRIPSDVVPAVPTSAVRRQLEALADVGDIVPLDELIARAEPNGRVRFAVTFDDDEALHVSEALPLLRSLGIRATFFLSGRALHGIGPYWWCCLEAMIAERGFAATCRVLGVDASSPLELASRLEGSVACDDLCRVAAAPDEPALDGVGIRALTRGGMAVGFHTLLHPVLTALGDEALREALARGRDDLAEAAGGPARFLAYPHGRADARVARAAAAAGYDAAFRAGGRPLVPNHGRFLLGRWEPGELGVDDFLASVALRLNRPVGAR